MRSQIKGNQQCFQKTIRESYPRLLAIILPCFNRTKRSYQVFFSRAPRFHDLEPKRARKREIPEAIGGDRGGEDSHGADLAGNGGFWRSQGGWPEEEELSLIHISEPTR